MMTKTGAPTNSIAGKISRSEIDGPDDALVALFPTKQSGVEFLKTNNAWGFVRITKSPTYVGMYVSGNEKQLKYIASVENIVTALDAPLDNPPETYPRYDPSKKVVTFHEGSLYELIDPIPFGERVIYSLRYTNLSKLKEANTTDELIEA